MPRVDRTSEARRQFRELPPDVAEEFARVIGFMAQNPHRLPPWCDVKLMGEQGGVKLFRVRVGDYRGTCTFDGEVIVFTRFKLRRNIDYGALPKV